MHTCPLHIYVFSRFLMNLIFNVLLSIIIWNRRARWNDIFNHFSFASCTAISSFLYLEALTKKLLIYKIFSKLYELKFSQGRRCGQMGKVNLLFMVKAAVFFIFSHLVSIYHQVYEKKGSWLNVEWRNEGIKEGRKMNRMDVSDEIEKNWIGFLQQRKQLHILFIWSLWTISTNFYMEKHKYVS